MRGWILSISYVLCVLGGSHLSSSLSSIIINNHYHHCHLYQHPPISILISIIIISGCYNLHNPHLYLHLYHDQWLLGRKGADIGSIVNSLMRSTQSVTGDYHDYCHGYHDHDVHDDHHGAKSLISSMFCLKKKPNSQPQEFQNLPYFIQRTLTYI